MVRRENIVRERVIETLKGCPQGLTIQEISKNIGMNRVTVAKYVYGLTSENAISQRKIGPAKLCSLVVE